MSSRIDQDLVGKNIGDHGMNDEIANDLPTAEVMRADTNSALEERERKSMEDITDTILEASEQGLFIAHIYNELTEKQQSVLRNKGYTLDYSNNMWTISW